MNNPAPPLTACIERFALRRHQQEQLNRDRGRDIGQNVERKDRKAVQAVAGESRRAAKEAKPDGRIDARQGNIRADPVDEESAEREGDPPPQLPTHLRRPRSFDRLISPSYWWASR